MHPKNRDDTLDTETTIQLPENNALVHLAVDDLIWYKINWN